MQRKTAASLLPFAALSAFLLTAGCGSGSSGGGGSNIGGSSSDTTPASRSMNLDMGTTSASLLASGTSGATAADALTDVVIANQEMTDLTTYTTVGKAVSRAVYTKTIGGMTVTLMTIPVSLRQTDFTVTLNGSVTQAGPTYSNFTFATGSVTRDRLNGKSGKHETVTYYQLRNSGQTTALATGDNWFFDDGSGQGSHIFTAGAYLTYTYDTADNWNWSAYTGGDATTGKLRAQAAVNADHSGSAKVFCVEDGQVRVQATWTSTGSGQVCAFPTACGNGDACLSFSK